MEILKKAKLICVTDANNNKFYNMEAQPDNTFLVTYGRVEGGKASTVVYPMSKWDSTIKSKLKKGYTDVTHLYILDDKKVEFIDISEKSISDFIAKLQRFTNSVVSDNYSISAKNVTKKMLDEAQTILNNTLKLVNDVNINDTSIINNINVNLLSLFKVLPRKMKNVKYFLVSDNIFDVNKDNVNIVKENINKMLSKEQDNLDSLSSKVMLDTVDETSTISKKLTLLDKLGIEMKEKDDELEKLVKEMLGELKDKFVNCWYVINTRTKKEFDNNIEIAKNKKILNFWHGSRNENWLSILEKGLMVRPSGVLLTGSMYGDGNYFADKARKSFGYTSAKNSYWARGNSDTAIMAIFDVHVGNQYHVNTHNSDCYKFSRKYLKNKGDYDSVYAHKGADLRNDEFIVYESSQCTIKAIVEMKS